MEKNLSPQRLRLVKSNPIVDPLIRERKLVEMPHGAGQEA